MRILLTLLFSVAFTILSYAQKEPVNIKEFKEGINQIPYLDLQSEDLIKTLQPLLIYPKFGRRKFIKYTSEAFFEINENGNIDGLKIDKPRYLMFDSISFKIAQATDGYWSPAKNRDGTRKKMDCALHITYWFTFSDLSKQIYYFISLSQPKWESVDLIDNKYRVLEKYDFLINGKKKLNYLTDSTNTFDALMRDSLVVKDTLQWIHSADFKKGKMVRVFEFLKNPIITGTQHLGIGIRMYYGTVKLGFQVTKDSQITNQQIIVPQGERMCKEALSDFSKLAKSWLPTHDEGVPIDSYNECNVSYDYLDENGSIHWNRTKWYYEHELYPKALKEVKKTYEYYIDDIEVIYKMAMLELLEGEAVSACEHLNKIQSLAIDKPYPNAVSEAMVNEAIEKYCIAKEEAK
jgi:hypothetical protein